MRKFMLAAAAVGALAMGTATAQAFDPVDGSGSAYGPLNLDPSGTRAMRRSNRVDRYVRDNYDVMNSYNYYEPSVNYPRAYPSPGFYGPSVYGYRRDGVNW